MKEVTFNKNSWHFRFITKVGDYSPGYNGPDICTYVRHFLWACTKSIILSFIGLVLGALLANFLYCIVMSIFHGALLFNPAAIAVAISLVIAGLAAGVVYLGNQAEEKRRQLRESGVQPADSFIKQAYRNWKHKTCVKIDFVE